MSEFEFLTVTSTGKRTRSAAMASDAGTLVREMEARGLAVLDLREREVDGGRSSRRVGHAALEDAMRALATLLPAGLPLARALDAAASTAPAPLAARLRDIRARVERGESLAAAFGAHGDLVSASAIGIIRAGERAGDLDGAFARLADQLEREGALRARLLSAAIYPALLVVAGGAAVLVLLLFVLPRFSDLLGGMGAPLPASTAWLLAAAAVARHFWWLFPIGAAALVIAASWLRLTPEGARQWARLLLHAPLVSGFRRELVAAECARLLAVLLRGEANLLTALDDATASLADPLARDALARVRERVRTGAPLHAALAAEPLFPPLLASLVATGEEAGRVQEFLSRAASLFEQRTERGVQRLVALAEPVMIIVFGALVGFVALSLLQAIYSVNPASMR